MKVIRQPDFDFLNTRHCPECGQCAGFREWSLQVVICHQCNCKVSIRELKEEHCAPDKEE